MNMMSMTLPEMLQTADQFVAAGRMAEAAALYEQLVTLAPQDAQLQLVLGLVYLELNRTEAAQLQLQRSIDLQPANPTAHRSLGQACHAAGKPAQALQAYQAALALNAADSQTWIALGNALHAMGDFEQALDAFHKAVNLDRADVRALNNLGKTYQDLLQCDRALACYDACLEKEPQYAEARFNRSTLLLAGGKYAEGWREYEWRFKRRLARQTYPHHLKAPRWTGLDFKGKRLLVHCEQGMGDVLQFARYLPWVKQLGGQLFLEVQPALLPLFSRLGAVDEVVAFEAGQAPRIAHDLQIPLMSLPLVFGTTPKSIPAQVPYLTIDPEKKKSWQHRLNAKGLRVGLVWASSEINPRRNCDLSLCGRWFDLQGASFFSLQKGPAAKALSAPTASAWAITPLGDLLHDFSDTAAAMAHLDLVISVDTAAAHLAGALGKPLWLLLPFAADWRWALHAERSPWYPTARLFRQTRWGCWKDVIERVARALGQTLSLCGPDAALCHKLSPNAREVAHAPIRPAVRQPKKIERILLISPVYGGSLEVIRYLHSGFQQAGFNVKLLDNSSFYPFFRQIEKEISQPDHRTVLQNQALATLDNRLIACAAEFKPQLVVAVAQSPVYAETLQKLKKAGIFCAYWFVEDHRFKTYWTQTAPLYDCFFTIQRDTEIRNGFERIGYANWHYLPLACDPAVHQPWIAAFADPNPYKCQIGFMGAPYLNRLKVFEKLTDYDLGIWGEGWDACELPPRLKACVREGTRRIDPLESVKIYSSADIVLNLHSSPFVEGIPANGDFVNPRTFEVAACQGFQLTDNRSELPALFVRGKEMIVFDNEAQLPALIDRWMEKPDDRKQIACKARQRACRDHTYQQRAIEMVEIITHRYPEKVRAPH